MKAIQPSTIQCLDIKGSYLIYPPSDQWLKQRLTGMHQDTSPLLPQMALLHHWRMPSRLFLDLQPIVSVKISHPLVLVS
jgi:hypothetical protein